MGGGNRKPKPGRSLEKLVASLERALGGKDGVKVESPKHLPDRVTGELREHDVVITFPTMHHEMTLAIECRDRSRKVTVNDVEAFVSKCQDTKIHKGVMVSPKGFWKPALTKAKNSGVTCLSLNQVESFPWLLAPGIRSRQRRVITTHWTLIPERDLVPKPTSFAVVDSTGTTIPQENMLRGALISDAAVADVDFGSVSGKLMIVYKQDEGGHVVFVPDPKADA